MKNFHAAVTGDLSSHRDSINGPSLFAEASSFAIDSGQGVKLQGTPIRPNEGRTCERLLSMKEVLIRTGLGRTTIYKLVNSGELTRRKVLRRTLFKESVIEAFMAGPNAKGADQ